MPETPKIERFLFGFGCVLVVVCSYFFFFDTALLGRMLGLISDSDHKVVAKVDLVQSDVRRKSYDTPDFQDLGERQNIFNKDTIMTGPSSVTLLTFNDGSSVQIGPDSLVIIDVQTLRNGELSFDLSVQKGSITTSNISDSFHLDGNAAPAPTVAMEPESSPATSEVPPPKVTESSKEKLPPTCTVKTYQVSAPAVSNAWNAQLTLNLACDPAVSSLEGVLIDNKGVDMGSPVTLNSKTTSVIIPVSKPGEYHFLVKQDHAKPAVIEVPSTYEALSWAKPETVCDGSVRWVDPELKATQSSLIDEKGKQVLAPTPYIPGKLPDVRDRVRLPTRFRALVRLESGFSVVTPILAVQRWAICPVLKLPRNGSNLDYTKKKIVFTWTALSASDRYLVQLSSDPDFRNIIFTTTSTRNFVRASFSLKGTYYWRVKELNSGTVSFPFTLNMR